MRVLLTESASMTCRETLTVLGRRGVRADVVSSGPITLGQFSRWRGRSVQLPDAATRPVAWVRALGALSQRYDAIIPTHEQAWLLAAGRHLLPVGVPVALADIEAFDQVQSKIAFAQTCGRLGLPQPRWWLPGQAPADAPPEYWVKSAFSTGGRGVRHVSGRSGHTDGTLVWDDHHERHFRGPAEPVVCQESAPGDYGQVQAVFDHGRMVGVHTSVKVGDGIGGSSAARLSVDHPEARDAIEALGRDLDWHGGLSLDHHHVDGHPQFIECNPRTLEPGNAAASGVDLPRLMIALARGEHPSGCQIGRPGVRTHSAAALVLGAASISGRRRSILRAASGSDAAWLPSEVLTPIIEDPPSAIPLVVTLARTLARPGQAERIASTEVARYAITPAMVDAVRS